MYPYLIVGQPEPGSVASKETLLIENLVSAAFVVLDLGHMEAVVARSHCGILLVHGVQRLTISDNIVL